MKRVFNIICALAVGALALNSCVERPPVDNPGDGPGGNQIEIPVGPEAIMRPDICTPVDYTPDMVEGGEDGVTIYISGKYTNNFKFVVRPGANIQSYRLDVYPLCRLYNSLFETAKAEGRDLTKEQLSKEVVESMIRGFIFDSSGAGAYTFSTNNMDDFLSHEFDWMNTPYSQAKVVPDCEYVIAAVGCFDTEGSEQGELSLCYVRTPFENLIGDPEVEVKVTPRYTSAIVEYVCNEDAKYYYQWCSGYDDLQPYIDAYGDKMYIDFMRNAIYEPTAADADIDVNTGLSPHIYPINFGMDASSEYPIMATAIGLDANFTPSKEFQRNVFTLKERDDSVEDANALLTVPEETIGASLFWVECYMPEGCGNAYMELISPEKYAEIQGYSEAQMDNYKLLLQSQTGDSFGYWGFTNQRYPNGEWTSKEPLLIGKPDTEYYIAYTAMNIQMELAPVKFVGPFRTKPLEFNTPEQSEEDAALTLTHDGATKVIIDFTYDFSKTACIHFQYIEGFGDTYYDVAGGSYSVPNENSPREEFIEYLYYYAYSNRWTTERGGAMHWTAILDPDTDYTIAYFAEDWNGVIGEVKFASTKTEQLAGGDNPVAVITGVKDEANGDYFLFESNEDTWGVYYMVGDQTMAGLSLEYLGDNKLSFRNAEKALAAWYDYCMEYKVNGGATLASSIKANVTRVDGKNVALCIPLGGSPDNIIFGEMVHLIYDNGEFYTIDHYYPAKSAAPAKSSLPRYYRQAQNKVVPIDVKCITPAGELFEYTLDYAKLSSHPKASGM